jgi:hypothetical protein
MPKTENAELTALLIEQQIVSRKEGRGEITKAEYEEQIEVIKKQIEAINRKTVDKLILIRDKKDEEEQRRIEKMPEEVKKKDGPTKVRGPKKDSYASLILETLQKKSTKSVDAAADAVVEKKPGRDRAKVRAQIVVMINEIKKGKKPAYTWDEPNFHLNLKV